MTRRITPKGAVFEFDYAARQYLMLRDVVNANTKPRDKFKGSIKEFIEQNGKEDVDGNLVVELEDPVTIGGDTYTGLMLRKEAVPVYDEFAAMELVMDKDLLDQIPSETVTVYDWEDGLHVLNALKKITDDELDEVMGEDIRYSLQVVK